MKTYHCHTCNTAFHSFSEPNICPFCGSTNIKCVETGHCYMAHTLGEC